jgi:hypothetical protein
MRLAKALAFDASSRAKPELKPLALRVAMMAVREKQEKVREHGTAGDPLSSLAGVLTVGRRLGIIA